MIYKKTVFKIIDIYQPNYFVKTVSKTLIVSQR